MAWAKKKYLNLAACVFVLIALVLILLFLLKGETSTTGQYPENDKSETLACTIEELKYPFLTDGSIVGENATVKMIFTDDNVDAVSFVLRVIYSSNSAAHVGSARLHADMNTSFGSTLGPDALGARYTVDGNVSQLSLYGKKTDINSNSRKYLLINNEIFTKQEFAKNYVDQGFKCE